MSGSYLKYCAPTGTVFSGIFDYLHESEWDVLSGTFRLRGSLRVSAPGEIQYAGDTIPANLAIVVKFYNAPDMKFEIRARKTSTGYVCFGLDLENNIIYIAKYEEPIKTVLAIQAHSFASDAEHYQIGFWMYDDALIGFINGGYIIAAENDFNSSETGWSLYVPEIYENIITAFTSIKVYSLKEYPDTPTIPDNALNIPQQYRKKLKNLIENPSSTSYASFVRARTAWENERNFGMKDEDWSELGYPVYTPMPESWFRTWTAVSGATSSPALISGLSAGTTYEVKLVSVDAEGDYVGSGMVTFSSLP